jgi:cyclic pyranopterin phosphate synthase
VAVHVKAETGESPLQEETSAWGRESAAESAFPAGLEQTPQEDHRRRAVALQSTGSVLQDRFGRVFDYLRIAVTDRCNLRCVYCMPEEGVDFAAHETLLRTEEILRLIGVASQLGVRKIRFTGGEPLVHKDIVALVGGAAQTPGIQTVHLTTNGVFLRGLAGSLRRAGLYGLNISLDTLHAERFQKCTRRAGIEAVLAGLDEALELDFPSVKINVVALRGFNDDELRGFAALTQRAPITVRFIELMPFDAHQIWRSGHFASTETLVKLFRELYPNCEVAEGSSTEHRIFQIPGHAGRVAFIPSYTRSLCGSCTRIRLTADGQIRNCLYSEKEYGLRDLLRNGGSDDEVARVLRQAMWEKLEDGRTAQRQAWERRGKNGSARESMTQIGG